MSEKKGVYFRETDCAEELIYPEEKFAMPELLDIEGKPHRFFEAYETTIPPFYVRSLKNGICYTSGEEVYTSEGRVVLEHSTLKKAPPVRWRRLLKNVTRVKGKVAQLRQICWEDNYYHWSTESLESLCLIRKSHFRPDFYVVPNSLRFQREWLSLLGIREEQILAAGQSVQADELIVPDLVNNNGVPIDFRKKLGQTRKWLPRWIGDLYSEFRLESGKGWGRIYISRAKARRRKVANEDSLLPLLGKYGFTVIHSENLSIREQIAAFANAEMVVGLHGAGLANCVLCPPHASVLEIYPQYYRDASLRALISAMNLRYFYMVGETSDTSMPPQQENVCVDPEKFEAALKMLIS
ncbi:MAG: glycosyltransferase family 61 protein [Synergistaceae bacterium]|jgi:hypothetical protein|nr:glycosyltransferase family 61 protein [Synergistaceae bacterium]